MIEVLKVILNIITRKEIYGVVVTLAVAYFVYRTATIALDEVINHGKNNYEKKKRRTVTNLFQNIIKYFILILALLVILSIYGVNVGAMIASLGIAATIIGLALQDTFKDIINGISIITENYFIVGDTVKYNTFTGEVIEFGLKSTKIKNVNGEVLTVANRNILEIINVSQKEQAVVINIPVAYEHSIDTVEQIINEQILPQIKKLENVNEESVKYLGVNELAATHIKYLLLFSCKRETHWQAKRDANKIILDELDKKNISTKYSQLEALYEK